MAKFGSPTLQWASLVAQTVKNLTAMRKTLVPSLGREDLLEKDVATHSNILAWRIPWTEEPGGLQSMGSQRVWHNWVTNTFTLQLGFPGGASGKESTCQCRRCKRLGFDPWVRKIPLQEEMAAHSSILTWEIPWTEEPGGLQFHAVTKKWTRQSNTSSLFFESKMKQVISALLSSEHCNENHGHLHMWSQNRECIQIETRLLSSEYHISTHAVLLTLNCKVCVLSYVLLFVLMPPAHVRGRKGPAGREVAAVGAWRREAGRKGRRTRLGQERDPQPRGKAPVLSVLSRHRRCLSKDTQMGSEKHTCVLKRLHFHSEEQCYLRRLILKMVFLSRAEVSKESGCPCRASAQPVWAQWAAPPAEPESDPKPSSRGASADRQPPHFTAGCSANL